MDLHNNPQNESGRLEQIVSQFLLKSLHIILDARTPLRRHDRKGDSPSVSRVRKNDKWFSLVLSDRPPALDNLNFWHKNSMDPMIIDILLVKKSPTFSFGGGMHNVSSVETVIERWVVQYEYPHILALQTGDLSAYYKKTYKKAIILLRSLYSMMRLLPTYKIFRQLSSSNQTYNFDVIYKVSSFGDPFSRAEEQVMKEYNFVPVEALPGHLSISVTYRSTLSDLNLEPGTSLPLKIIADYVGSPTTDPLRYFNSVEKGFCATSVPLKDTQPPSSSAASQRPHSWTSGFNKTAHLPHNQLPNDSPTPYRMSPTSYDFPFPTPSSPDVYANRVNNYRPTTLQKTTSFDMYQLSPPFSPSPSPSPPTYHNFGIPMQNRVRSGTAPVTIPLPVVEKSSKYTSPNSSDPARHSLPPPSPRSSRTDRSSQDSSSGIKSIRKTDGLRAGELYSGMANHHSSSKVVDISKDDSGRFSGLLSSCDSPRIGFSRSSSRLSFQDDLDDYDVSCPFDVDDIDPSDASVRKSQDAAVGALVHMFRTAPPLRQDRSFYSSQSMQTEFERDVGTLSGFFLPRKTSDALEELRSYKDMKDLLLSRSGTQMVSKEKA